MFYPSEVANRIYEFLDLYETEGLDLYNAAAVDDVDKYLDSIGVEHEVSISEWIDEEGGACGIAFIDGGHPHLVMFDFKYN